MNTLPGYGDEATWPKYNGQPGDPRAPLSSAWEQALDIAHNAERVAELRARKLLDDVQIKVDSEFRDLLEADELLRMRVMTGRYPEADCIARDITTAIVSAVEKLIEEDRL
ncbi:MAG TPA: hypothetical protein VGE10_11000 [Zeimonas sp.]